MPLIRQEHPIHDDSGRVLHRVVSRVCYWGHLPKRLGSMMAGEQQLLLLWEGPKPKPQKVDRFALAFSDEVSELLLKMAQNAPDRWLGVRDFASVGLEFDIRSYLGHALHQLVNRGLLQDRAVYFGSDHPSKPNYLGYANEYMSAAHPAVPRLSNQEAAWTSKH